MVESGSGGRPAPPRAGAQAVKPGSIPWRGWWQILGRVWDRWHREGYDLVSAGLAFRGLLTAFPAMLAMMALLGLVVEPDNVIQATRQLLRPLPDTAREVLVDQLASLSATNHLAMGVGFLLAALVGLWSLGAGTAALMKAYHLIYREHEHRSLWKSRLIAIVIGSGLLVGWFVALALVVAVPAILSILPVPALVDVGTRVLRWIVLGAFMILIQDALARFAVDRSPPRWRWLQPGSLVSVILWLLACGGLSLYTQYATRLSVTYGGVVGVVVLLLWLYLSTMAVLIGALIDSEAEHQTRRDTTTGPELPFGERGAWVADHSAATGETPDRPASTEDPSPDESSAARHDRSQASDSDDERRPSDGR